ncbi:MAG: methyltransferase domain-containing protein [Gammaproteobacteria bacterium]|jgi:ubiquinone/menaquinone biosynthesis C-methylase UbiE/uncharacterized protein YbaR (Trm112 family)|nr:methyltransferase domain-containing protein [Gammaproteobacteria bacterium]
MYKSDLNLLCCPATGEPLEISSIDQQDADSEILEGELRSAATGQRYPIRNGIPRFADSDYNPTWDYKWTQIDAGEALNYWIMDKSDPAHAINDLFDRNAYGGAAFRHATNRVVLDIGCGIGQYSVRLAQEYGPRKVVSMDLTRGVDIFRGLVLERFPELRGKILFVQGSVFALPFPPNTFDYVFSLGVLMHTGNTLQAIRNACGVLKAGGQLNIWVYASTVVASEVKEKGRRVASWTRSMAEVLHLKFFWLGKKILRLVPHRVRLGFIRLVSSRPWYAINRTPVLGQVLNFFIGTSKHPDRSYRYINNYDSWINTWDDTWSEHEIFPVLREQEIAVQGVCEWRVGFWGVKDPGFYRPAVDGEEPGRK